MATDDILTKIESMKPFLSPTELKIANVILENPKDIVMLSTKMLSAKCDVSEPSLIRFTQKLGYSGFKEFKLKLSASLGTKSNKTYPMNIEQDDSALDIYKKLSAYIITSINNTMETLSNDELEKAIELIDHASKNNKTIFLSGMGASGLQVHNLQVKLMRLNINTVLYDDIHLRLEACTNLKKGDLLICITTLGSAMENYQIIDIAKDRGANIIVITQYGNTKIAEKADVILYMSNMENNSRFVSHAAISVQNLIIDTIFFSIAFREYDEMTENVKETRDIFSKYGHYARVEGKLMKIL